MLVTLPVALYMAVTSAAVGVMILLPVPTFVLLSITVLPNLRTMSWVVPEVFWAMVKLRALPMVKAENALSVLRSANALITPLDLSNVEPLVCRSTIDAARNCVINSNWSALGETPPMAAIIASISAWVGVHVRLLAPENPMRLMQRIPFTLTRSRKRNAEWGRVKVANRAVGLSKL
jgi:hypothetical protein